MSKFKVLRTVCCVAFLVALIASFSVSAATKPEEVNPVKPQYIVSCDGGGKHEMHPKGTAIVYKGSYNNPGKRVFKGFCFQCSKCYLALASEGSPIQSGVLGRYKMENIHEPIYGVHTNFYGDIDGSYEGSLLSDPYWAGFVFYHS